MIQGSESFRLIVRRGPQPNQTYELNKDIITLGRDITNDIVINDPEVSRHHLRMTRGAGGFTVEDLGSTNGTFINGQRLTGARPLRNGDMVGLGETVTLGYEMIVAASPDAGLGGMPPGNTVPGAAARGGMPAGVSPMPVGGAPMQQQPQQQPAPSPYAPGGAPMGGVGAPPQQPAAPMGAQQGQPQQGYGGYNYTPASSYSPAPSPYGASGTPGAVVGDYDPYAVRDEEPRSTTRWVLIGCAAISLFCCCSSVLGLVAVDQLCLWDRIPILYDVLRAFGYAAVC